MAQLLSFPFRLTAAGTIAVREDASDEYFGEELAQLLQTAPGERELVPTYGVHDPAFAEVDVAMLSAAVKAFGPPVVIEEVTTRYVVDGTQDVVVAFSAVPRAAVDDLDDATPQAGALTRATDEEFD